MADSNSKKKKKKKINLIKEFKDVFSKPSAFGNVKAARELVRQDKSGK